jgi:hypothetical protein
MEYIGTPVMGSRSEDAVGKIPAPKKWGIPSKGRSQGRFRAPLYWPINPSITPSTA